MIKSVDMKKIFSIFCFLLIFSVLSAQIPVQQLEAGNHYYEVKDYASAVQSYNAVLASGYCSAQLYYNLGNAYYRQNEIAQSILNYERALRITPNDREIQENLALANSKTQDQMNAIPQLFVVRIWKGFVQLFSTRGWCIVALLCLLLFGSALLLFLFANQYAVRKFTFVFGVVLLCCFLLSGASVFASRHHKTEAIVMATMTTMKSSPEVSSIDKLIVHAGTKLEVEETIQDWHKVRLPDGNTGWIQTSVLEII